MPQGFEVGLAVNAHEVVVALEHTAAPRDEGLKATAKYSVKILDVGDGLRSIEVGNSATLIITDGDPPEIRTIIGRVFNGGLEADLTTHQFRLHESCPNRPTLD